MKFSSFQKTSHDLLVPDIHISEEICDILVKQAEGNFSDCILRPVRLYHSFDIAQYPTHYVLCEVIDALTGNAHESNKRNLLG